MVNRCEGVAILHSSTAKLCEGGGVALGYCEYHIPVHTTSYCCLEDQLCDGGEQRSRWLNIKIRTLLCG